MAQFTDKEVITAGVMTSSDDDSDVISHMILYTNDGVEVTYSNGTKVHLSPCGSAFLHEIPTHHHNTPYSSGLRKVQHRSCFATSIFRTKVKQALDFRNRFSEHPYLCEQLLDPTSVLKTAENIHTTRWLKSTDDHHQHLSVLRDGYLQFRSAEGHALILLAPNRHDFTFQYKARLSTEREEFTTQTKQGSSLPNRDRDDGNIGSENSDPQSDRDGVDKTEVRNSDEPTPDQSPRCYFKYSWVVQHHSINNCPPFLEPILKIILSITPTAVRQIANYGQNHATPQKNRPNRSEAPDDTPTESSVYVKLQPSLESCCQGAHLHPWRRQRIDTDNINYWKGHRIKVIYTEGVIFRMSWGSQCSVEIYPGDGSVMTSRGITGNYFTHYKPIATESEKIFEVEEKVYSMSQPPPKSINQSMKYSLARLISQGSRLMRDMSKTRSNDGSAGGDGSHVDNYCCWKYEFKLSRPKQASLLEECVVPGLGKFSAFSTGRIRVLFDDLISLDMRCGQGVVSMTTTTPVMSSSNISTTIPSFVSDPVKIQESLQLSPSKLSQPSAVLDLPVGVCRILGRNGQYRLVSTHTPPVELQRHVSAALEWAAWVHSSPVDRQTFYQDTVCDVSKTSGVMAELEKIRRFNYLLDGACPVSNDVITPRTSLDTTPVSLSNHNTYNQSSDLATTNHSLSLPAAPPSRTMESTAQEQTCDTTAPNHSDTSNRFKNSKQVPAPSTAEGVFNETGTDRSRESGERFDASLVEAALRKTSEAIGEINSMLEAASIRKQARVASKQQQQQQKS